MIPLIILLKNASGAAPSGISVDSVSAIVEPDGVGSCSCPWTAAEVYVVWTSTGFVGATHEYVLYRDGVELYRGDNTTFDNTVVSETADVHAFVDGTIATTGYWNADWDYRVDIVETATGAVLASKAVNYTNVFGKCAGAFC